MDDFVNQLVQSIPLLTQALAISIFFIMTGIAFMLTWVVMKLTYAPFNVASKKYDSFLNPMFANAISPIFAYISSVITGVFSSVESVFSFLRGNFILVVTLITLSAAGYVWNKEHHKLIPYIWELQQCYITPTLYDIFAIANLVRLFFDFSIALVNLVRYLGRFWGPGLLKLLLPCTWNNANVLIDSIEDILEGAGKLLVALANFATSNLLTARLETVDAWTQIFSAFNPLKNVTHCACAWTDFIVDPIFDLPQAPSLAIALDALLNIPIRMVQELIWCIVNFQLSYVEDCVIEIQTFFLNTGLWIEDIFSAVFQILTDLTNMIPTSTTATPELAMFYYGEALGMSITESGMKPTFVDSWNALLVKGSKLPDNSSLVTAQDLSLADLLGLTTLQQMLTTHWMYIVTKPLCYILGGYNATEYFIADAINGQLSGNYSDLRYFQAGYLFDWLRGMSYQVGELGFMIDDYMPCTVYDGIDIVIDLGQMFWELFILLIYYNLYHQSSWDGNPFRFAIDYFNNPTEGAQILHELALNHSACIAGLFGCVPIPNDTITKDTQCTGVLPCLALNGYRLGLECLWTGAQLTFYMTELVQFKADKTTFMNITYVSIFYQLNALATCVKNTIYLLDPGDENGTPCESPDGLTLRASFFCCLARTVQSVFNLGPSILMDLVLFVQTTLGYFADPSVTVQTPQFSSTIKTLKYLLLQLSCTIGGVIPANCPCDSGSAQSVYPTAPPPPPVQSSTLTCSYDRENWVTNWNDTLYPAENCGCTLGETNYWRSTWTAINNSVPCIIYCEWPYYYYKGVKMGMEFGVSDYDLGDSQQGSHMVADIITIAQLPYVMRYGSATPNNPPSNFTALYPRNYNAVQGNPDIVGELPAADTFFAEFGMAMINNYFQRSSNTYQTVMFGGPIDKCFGQSVARPINSNPSPSFSPSPSVNSTNSTNSTSPVPSPTPQYAPVPIPDPGNYYNESELLPFPLTSYFISYLAGVTMQDFIKVINYDFISQDCPAVGGSDFCDFPDLCQASFLSNTTQYYVCQLYLQGVWYPTNQKNPPYATASDWHYLSAKLATFFKTYNDAFINCPLSIDQVPIDSCFFFVPTSTPAINPGAFADNWKAMKTMSTAQFAPVDPPASCNCSNISGLWETGQGYCLLQCDPPEFPYWVGFNYASDYCNTSYGACNVGPVYYFRSLEAILNFMTFNESTKIWDDDNAGGNMLPSIGGANQSFARGIVDPDHPNPNIFDGRWLMLELLVAKLNVYYQIRHNGTVTAYISFSRGACLPESSLRDVMSDIYLPDLVKVIERAFLPQVYGVFASDLTHTRFRQDTEVLASRASLELFVLSVASVTDEYIGYSQWMSFGYLFYKMLRQITTDSNQGYNKSSCLDFKVYTYPSTSIPTNPYDVGSFPFPPEGADLTFPSIDGLKTACPDLSNCTTTVLESAFEGLNIVFGIVIQVLAPIHQLVAAVPSYSFNFGTSLVTIIEFVALGLVQWVGSVILAIANWVDCLLCALAQNNPNKIMCERILFSALYPVVGPISTIADALIKFVVTIALGIMTFFSDFFSLKFGDAITVLWNTIVNTLTNLLPQLLVLILRQMLSAICLCGLINTLAGSEFCTCTCGCGIGKKRSLVPAGYGAAELAPQVYDIFAPYWYIYSDEYKWDASDSCNATMPVYRQQYFTLQDDTWPNDDIPQEITFCLGRFIWKLNASTPGRLTIHDADKCSILMQGLYNANPVPAWMSLDLITRASVIECIQQRAIIVTAKSNNGNGTLDWLPDNIISSGGFPSVVNAFVLASLAAPIFMQRAADLNYPLSTSANDATRASSIIEIGGANFGTPQQRAAAFANGVPSIEAYVDATPGIPSSKRNAVVSMVKMLDAQFGQEAQETMGTITYTAIDTSMAHLPSPPNSSEMMMSVASFTEDLINASSHPSGKGISQKMNLHMGQATASLWKAVKTYGTPKSGSTPSLSKRRNVDGTKSGANLTTILRAFKQGISISTTALYELFSGQAYLNVSTMVTSDANNTSPYPTVIPWQANPNYRPLNLSFSSIKNIFPERIRNKFAARFAAVTGLFRSRKASIQTQRVYNVMGAIYSAYNNGTLNGKYHYQMPVPLRASTVINGVTCLVSDELCQECMVLDQLIGDVINAFAICMDYFKCTGPSPDACFTTAYNKFIAASNYIKNTNGSVWIGDSPTNPIRFPTPHVVWYRYAGDQTPNKLRFHDVEALWNQTYNTILSILGNDGFLAGTTEGSFTIASCSNNGGSCSNFSNAVARPTKYRGEMDVLASLASKLLRKAFVASSTSVTSASSLEISSGGNSTNNTSVVSELENLILPWLSWLYDQVYTCDWTTELDDGGKRFSIGEGLLIFLPAIVILALLVGVIVPSSFMTFFAMGSTILLGLFLTLVYSWSYACFYALPVTLADDIMYALVFNLLPKGPFLFNGLINEPTFTNDNCVACNLYKNRTFTVPNCYDDIGFTSFIDNIVFLLKGYDPSIITYLEDPTNFIEPFQTILRQEWLQERLTKWDDFDPTNEISYSQHYQCATFVTFIPNAIEFVLVLILFGLTVPIATKSLMLVCSAIWIGFWFMVSTVVVIVCIGDMTTLEGPKSDDEEDKQEQEDLQYYHQYRTFKKQAWKSRYYYDRV